jgi:asparagine N-glycosylation enzyme membrane subunit Stt3
MRKSTGFALLSIFFVAVLLRFLPLTRYLYWGADFGEHFILTKDLIVNGHLVLPYLGWGFTYPYFPGMFAVSAVVGFTSASIAASVALIPTFLAALSIFPVFLIGRNLYHEDSVGLIAAGIAAVAMPAVYTTSHAVPGSVGDLLFVTCLLLFLKSQTNPKMYYLLYPVSLALIVTHHLTAYFLIIVLIAAVFFQELISKKSDAKNLKLSVIFLAVFTLLTFLYWLAYATPFRDAILSRVQGTWWGVIIGFVLAVLVLFAVIKLRRRVKWRYHLVYPDLRNRLGLLAFGFVSSYTIMAIIVFVAVPGTTIQLDISAFYFFTPLIVVLAFAIAGRRMSEFSKRGFDPLSWFIALSLSLVFGTLFASDVIIPYRHMQYMIPSIAVIGGLGISRLSGLFGATQKRGRLVASSLVVVLIIALAATSYPPRDILAGHQEGIESKAVTTAHFSNVYAQGLVATDHRVSSILFGFGGTNATWDTAPNSLLADTFEEASPEMLEVRSPSGRKRVDYVVIDSDVEEGAMLFPWDPAPALNTEAIEKFEKSPYMKFFDNGYSRLYYVNWGLASPG